MLFASCTPKKPKTIPITIVLNACARPEINVTLVTSCKVQLSFLPIANTGSQWFGITACKRLNKRLPIKMLYIL